MDRTGGRNCPSAGDQGKFDRHTTRNAYVLLLFFSLTQGEGVNAATRRAYFLAVIGA